MHLLRKYIQSVLQEATELLGRRIEDDNMEDFRRVKSNAVPGWIANVANSDRYTNAVYIYDENGDYAGCITDDGGYRLPGSFQEYKPGKFNLDDDNSIQQAIRYLFLQTQKKQALSESYKRDAEISVIDIPGIEYWHAERFNLRDVNIPANGHWKIYTGGRYSLNNTVGRIYDNGTLTYWKRHNDVTQTREKRPELGNNPIKAARYLFLHIPEYNPIKSESSKPILKEEVEHSQADEYGIIEIPEFSYIIQPKTHTNNQGTAYGDGWNIKKLNYPNSWVAHLSKNGMLYYDDVPKSTNRTNWDHHVKFTGTPQQAARYVWLKRQKTVKTESSKPAIEEIRKLGKIISLKGTDYYAKRPTMANNIYDIFEEEIGEVGAFMHLKDDPNSVIKDNILYYNDRIKSDVYHTYDKSVSPFNGGILQALRYISLKRQEKNPVEESFGFGHEVIPQDIGPGDEIVYPKIDNWKIRRIGLGSIKIYDSENNIKGKINYEGDYDYRLYFDISPNQELFRKNKKVSAKDFTRAGIERVVRWLFLNSQQQTS